MTDKKKLPLLGKSLMPEILPAPPARTGAGPRERVLARLKQITQTAAIAAAATLSACEAGGGAMPPPAGAGAGGKGPGGGNGSAAGVGAAAGSGGAAGAVAGSSSSSNVAGAGSGGRAGAAAGSGGTAGMAGAAAGSGGAAGMAGAGGAAGGGGMGGAGRIAIPVAGYGVVDPMPNPALCPDPSALVVKVQSAKWLNGMVQVTFDAGVQSPGYLKTAVATPSSVTASIASLSQLSLAAKGTWPATVNVDLGIECLTGSGTTIAHVTLRLDTSKAPVDYADVPTQIIRQ